MSRHLRNFIGGALGALALEIVFFVRYPEGITQCAERLGTPGLAVAGATLVLLAALTGLLALAAHPHHIVGAALFGVIPPALLLAADLPRYGVDPACPHRSDGVWLVLSPVRHVADGVSAGVVAREAEVVAAAVDRTQGEAAERRRAAVAATVADVLRDTKAMHAEELARVRAEAVAERRAEAERLQAATDAQVATLTTRLERETTTARAAVEARERAEAESATLRADVERLRATEGTTDELERQLAVAAERREEIVREREDYRRLVEWYRTDVPADGPTPLRLLSRRLASRSAEDRIVAARLLALCGPAARAILTRARADADPAVRQAVETTLVGLDR